MEENLSSSERILEERFERRTQELETLLDTVRRGADQFRAISELAQSVTSILDVDVLLGQTARLIRDTFGYYHVHIGLIEGEMLSLPASAGVWKDEAECHLCATLHLKADQDAICSIVAFGGQTMLVPDISQEPRYLHPSGAIGSGVVVPLTVKGQVIGLLDVEHAEPNAFDESDVAVLQLLANQVAVAIENARLYRQAQSLAALQERQKLARELHDSVSQALYGIGLGARTALKLAESDSTEKRELVQPLEYILSLATTGMAEMRALIFELRPESLENEGLVAALEKQVLVLQARYQLSVSTAFPDEPALPLIHKETLYRIAQEALHNVVKHARATEVDVRLFVDSGETVLEIKDNGIGFDPQGSFPGHLGLQSMRERITSVGGRLTMESTPGHHTMVRATL